MRRAELPIVRKQEKDHSERLFRVFPRLQVRGVSNRLMPLPFGLCAEQIEIKKFNRKGYRTM